MQRYDPEDWSILDRKEQQHIETVVRRTREDDLSIRTIFHYAHVPHTPSRYAFIRATIVKRLTGR